MSVLFSQNRTFSLVTSGVFVPATAPVNNTDFLPIPSGFIPWVPSHAYVYCTHTGGSLTGLSFSIRPTWAANQAALSAALAITTGLADNTLFGNLTTTGQFQRMPLIQAGTGYHQPYIGFSQATNPGVSGAVVFTVFLEAIG